MIAAHHVDRDRLHAGPWERFVDGDYSFSSLSAGFSMTRRPR